MSESCLFTSMIHCPTEPEVKNKYSERKIPIIPLFWLISQFIVYFPGSSDSKESACNAGDTGDWGLISGSGKSPEEGSGSLL